MIRSWKQSPGNRTQTKPENGAGIMNRESIQFRFSLKLNVKKIGIFFITKFKKSNIH